jgi:PAS domain S-box-containing protein
MQPVHIGRAKKRIHCIDGVLAVTSWPWNSLNTCFITAFRHRDPKQALSSSVWLEILCALALLGWLGLKDQAMAQSERPVNTNVAGPTTSGGQDQSSEVLTQAAQLHTLMPEAAAAKRRVRLTGVVTYFDAARSHLFMQDATDGIEVDTSGQQVVAPRGRQIQVEGVTVSDAYAPLVHAERLVILDPAAMPEPVVAAIDQLHQGWLEGRRVEISGTLRGYKLETNHTRLTAVAQATNLFQVFIPHRVDLGDLNRYLGLRLRFRGVCATRVSTNRILPRLQFYVQDWSQEGVCPDEPIPVDPFAVPTVPISQAIHYTYRDRASHRIKVSGIVTSVRSWGDAALQDSTGALFAEIRQTHAVRFGDRIEALGFPVLRDGQLMLEGVSSRVLATNQHVTPEPVEPDRILRGNFAGRLVTLQGYFIRKEASTDRCNLVLKQQQDIFNVVLEGDAYSEAIKRIKVGSFLQVTGACNIMPDSSGGVESFRILCWHPGQVRVLHGPRVYLYIVWVIAGAGGIVLMALVWVYSLRIQVRRQTAVIEQKCRHEALLEGRYRELFEQANDLIFEVETNERLTAVNAAVARTTGYSKDELLHMKLPDLLTPEAVEPARHWVRQVLQGSLSCINEWSLKARKGQLIILEVTAHKIGDGESSRGLHCIGRDLTERRSLESQLRQAQKMESIGQLAAGIAHDYNNLLTVILGNTDFLINDPRFHPETRQPLEEISDAGRKAANLTRQLLTFSRKQALQTKRVDLNDLLRHMASMLSRLLGENIQLDFNYGTDLPFVEADPGMMEQVILNLAINARDAIRGQGRITLATSLLAVDEAGCHRNREARIGTFLCLHVADTGCGMDASVLSRLFEPFFTTKDPGKGTGLGLATVFSIVKQHRGWIEVDSLVGQGSQFRVFLPATDALFTETPMAAAPSLEVQGHETILLVEDEVALRLWATKVLEKSGYTVLQAGSGPEAVRIWSQHHTRIALLLTDMVMPGGMTGRKLAEQLLDQSRQLKVIYTSGYSLDFSDPEFAGVETRFLLQKPYGNADLLRTVRECLLSSTVRQNSC